MRLALLLLAACTSDDGTSVDIAGDAALDPACVVEGDRPAGWGAATHANEAEPDYDAVFDRGVVRRVDITLAAADYAAMYAELVTVTGSAFGEGGGGPPDGGGGPGGDPSEAPPEVLEAMAAACEGLASGDACSVAMGPETVDGTCTEYDGALLCLADDMGGGGGPGTDLTEGDPSYVEATVAVDGTTWCGVGMRFKGNSSLLGAWSEGIGKLPFRLDFDHYEDERPETDDQRFFGFKELSFGNGYGDATLIRDVLASEILTDRGVPAARNAFWKVYVDAGEGPVYFGLYTASEDPSDAFADRVWGDDDGNLYKPDGDCADLTCFDAATFEKKSNEDAADYTDVEALVAVLAADRTDAAAWRAELEAVLDVDGFLRWLAVNSAIENWDAYGLMAHNYYLYGVPADGGRLAWIPWDHNLSLMDGYQGEGDPLLADISEEWPLIRHVLDDPTYAATYRGYLADALDGLYAADAFEARAEALRAVVAEAAAAEGPGFTFLDGADAFDAAFDDANGLYDHAEERRAEVEAALAE